MNPLEALKALWILKRGAANAHLCLEDEMPPDSKRYFQNIERHLSSALDAVRLLLSETEETR